MGQSANAETFLGGDLKVFGNSVHKYVISPFHHNELQPTTNSDTFVSIIITY